ncbi:MAG: nitroreductase family protein [Pseudomonadales bacterium]|nr:nitroreductase family protein [Pseudomonadales bacterium]
MPFLDSLNWRFAAKHFSSDKKVSAEDLDTVLEAIRMAPTSFGMQPFHAYVVSNKDVLKELRAASFDQAQVEESSYYIVFAARTDGVDRVDEHIEALAAGDPEKLASLEKMRSIRKKSLSKKSPEELVTWARNQVYIALGFALAAAAELRIDSCPMEGFLPAEYAKILQMPDTLIPAVSLALGYRKEGPERPKFRFSNEDLFTHVS